MDLTVEAEGFCLLLWHSLVWVQGQCLQANGCVWACWGEAVLCLVLGPWQPEEWLKDAMSWSKCLQNWCRYVAQQNNTVFAPPYKLWVTEPFKLLLLAFRVILQIRNLWMGRLCPGKRTGKKHWSQKGICPQTKLTFSLFIAIYYHCSDLGHSHGSRSVAFDLLHWWSPFYQMALESFIPWEKKEEARWIFCGPVRTMSTWQVCWPKMIHNYITFINF